MKKLFALLTAFFAVSLLTAGEEAAAVSADEAAVREVIPQFQRCLREFDIAGGLGFICQQEYEYIDADGNKSDFSDLQEELTRLAAMGKVLSVTAKPEATLLELVSAVFAMNSDELDQETKALVSSVAATAEGRKLAEESRRTLADMLETYHRQRDEWLDGFTVVSVAIEGNTARLIYTVSLRDERPERVTAVLQKGSDGKWRIRQQRAVYAEADGEM